MPRVPQDGRSSNFAFDLEKCRKIGVDVNDGRGPMFDRVNWMPFNNSDLEPLRFLTVSAKDQAHTPRTQVTHIEANNTKGFSGLNKKTRSQDCASRCCWIPAASKSQTSGASASEGSGAPSSPMIPILNPAEFATGKGGGALRSIDQKFAVNTNTGTLSLSVSLLVAETARNFYPTLSLEYNSGSWNGPFGMGWQLGGLGSITRKRREASSPILMGPMMTKTATAYVNTHPGFVVTPKRRSNVRRGCLLTTGDSILDDFWRIISTDNITRVYGRNDSSHELENQHRIFAWLLCEAYDDRGNAMSYQYKSEDEQGIAELPNDRRAIEQGRDAEARGKASVLLEYGGHDSMCPATVESETGCWSIRSDPFSSGNQGFEYSSLPDIDSLKIQSMCPSSLQSLSVSRPSAVTRWIDLDGEGSPGLLVQLDEAWYYQRNESALVESLSDGNRSDDDDGRSHDELLEGVTDHSDSDSSIENVEDSEDDPKNDNHATRSDRFGPICQLQAVPTIRNTTNSTFGDLGSNGCQDLLVTGDLGRTIGFHERLSLRFGDPNGWSAFQPIPAVLNVDFASPKAITATLSLDMTGGRIT
ncbi:hypothetical protein B0H63DRAFT_518069 [Podospora didyma]|uniref:Uncharacterized protein n=1 Tax=Podospora didyma TaxID=330526 RepID=A0AAE0U8K0_9PEZI|nr:hypothetical protein B0H63DRAFT_518069 [Podospora didyma]